MSWNYAAQANAMKNLGKAPRRGQSPNQKGYVEKMNLKRGEMKATASRVFQEVWGKEDAYKKLLGIYQRFTLSPFSGTEGAGITNAALIYAQRPNAVCLKTLDGYNAQQDKILPGEKAIDLLAPHTTVRDGKPATFYNPVKVFDLSQTTSKAVPPQPPEPDYLGLLRAIANAERFSIDYADLPDGIGALYVPENEEVLIQDGQEPKELLVSLLTEYSHYQLSLANGYDRNQVSVFLACSSAYVLALHYGVDTKEMNFPKEAFPEAKEVGTIKEMISTVAQVSKRVAKDVDQQLVALTRQPPVQETQHDEVQI